MKTWRNSPQKLLIIHNQQFFSLPAWLPKRPILGRNRNFIGSPCLLSTISLWWALNAFSNFTNFFVKISDKKIAEFNYCLERSNKTVNFLKKNKFHWMIIVWNICKEAGFPADSHKIVIKLKVLGLNPNWHEGWYFYLLVI